MAGIYDTHIHLNDVNFLEEGFYSSELVDEAKTAGITHMNNVGFDIRSSKIAVVQATKNKNVYAVVGIHPTQIHMYDICAIEEVENLTYANKVVAIGEIGLDYRNKNDDFEKQKDFFKAQLELALKRKLPVVIHVGDVPNSDKAYKDILEILLSMKIKKALIHSFNSSLEIANKFISNGYFISFNGEITRDKKMEEVIKNISLNSLMLESNAPYNTPKPYNKNSINHPKFINLTIDKIAKIKNLSSEDVISSTQENATKFFKV